jgi:hypothetical protein
MRQKEVFKKIGAIIQEISDQYEYLKTVKDDLNDLELELFVANAHFLADHAEILYKLNLQKEPEKRLPEKKEENIYEQKYFEPVVQSVKHAENNKVEKTEKEPVKPVEFEITGSSEDEDSPVAEIDIRSESPADSYSFIREEPETIRHELILDEAMDFDEDEQPLTGEEPVEDIKRKKTDYYTPTEEPVAEATEIKPEESNSETEAAPAPATEEEMLTINQKMSSQLKEKETRTEQLSIKPISDIKLAITLNDKLLYVKDLFNGYNLAYSEAIEILNRFNTFEEASRFLKTNYVTKNNWDSKPVTTEKFYELLKRRYA